MNKRSRAQILLQDEQYRRLHQIAMRQGRYIPYVTREVIQAVLEAAERESGAVWQRRMEAIHQLSQLREEVEPKRGAYLSDLLAEVRSEREQQLDEAKKGTN